MNKITKQLTVFFEAIKFEHTLFALPFAYIGAFLGNRGWPGWNIMGWMTLAMVGARTAGMALNRIIDIEIDRKNPRTSNRALPKGLLSSSFVWFTILFSIALLELASLNLSTTCLWLSPIAVLLLFAYSYTKRFTWFSHIVLGVVIACAPLGGAIAVSGGVSFPIIILGVAVIFWLAGFDIIYACLDYEFDKKEGLYSIPAIFGVPLALKISALFHCITFICLVLTGVFLELSFWYYIGNVLVGLLLWYQHYIVSPKDLSRLNTAFFTANASISVTLFVFVALSFW